MQYTTRSLFGFVTASAVLVGFMGLPTDFKALLILFAFAWVSFGICFQHAIARKISSTLLAAVILVWAATAVLVLLPTCARGKNDLRADTGDVSRETFFQDRWG